MSKADEMFEKLGYVKEETEFIVVYSKGNYKKKNLQIIHFLLDVKKLQINDNYIYQHRLHLNEIQAIVEKCKELGWLE